MPKPAEVPRGREVHLLVALGAHEHRVRVERVEHAVAGGVLDLAQIDLVAVQVLLQEREHLAQLGGDVPGAEHVVDPQLLLLGVDADRHFAALVGQHDDLGHIALDEVERARAASRAA